MQHTRRLRFIFGEFGENENITALDVMLSITLEGGTWHVQAEGIEATGDMLLATACAWLTKRCTADL